MPAAEIHLLRSNLLRLVKIMEYGNLGFCWNPRVFFGGGPANSSVLGSIGISYRNFWAVKKGRSSLHLKVLRIAGNRDTERRRRTPSFPVSQFRKKFNDATDYMKHHET